MKEIRVAWLTPDKPENISVGRQRIMEHLQAADVEITLRAATVGTLIDLLRRQSEYDVIIGTTRAGAILGGVTKLLTQTPLVVDHVDPIRQFRETNAWWLAVAIEHLENAAFRLSDHTLYVYSEEKKRVHRFANSCSETSLGVEFDRFAEPDPQTVADAQSRLAEYSLAENVAIYVGGLEPIYHIEELIAAFDHLENWSLVVLGSGTLETEVREAGEKRDDIIFLGTVTHTKVPGFLHFADVGISLVDDPHTLKVLEYGAARLPTVQLAGRAQEKLGDAVEYCEPEPVSIAESIKRAKTMETAHVDTLQSRAKQFSWQRISEEYATVLREVVRDPQEE